MRRKLKAPLCSISVSSVEFFSLCNSFFLWLVEHARGKSPCNSNASRILHLASARILEKCGFQREGTLRAYKICRGAAQDFWMFAQLRREYKTDATD
jgi:hypothetical protein